ncbi:MAG: UDP-glucose/GDP-mannose dehydrogenase family protein [Gammaproteobacteria bacterium]
MNVTIFGSGYVGLVTGVCLAETGNHVYCVDVDDERISTLNRGHVPFYEPGLQEMLSRNLASGRLTFTTDARQAVEHGLFQFIAVGTPPEEDGSADLSHVLDVAQTIGENLEDYRVVACKSTVPVGTTHKVQARIRAVLDERGSAAEFDVASNPEFLKEGAAVNDFMRPDRIVVGVDNPRVSELLRTLYEPYTRNRERLNVMDVRSAELTKYAANAMLATKISFMNELAGLAERFGADIEQIRLAIGADPRIGYHYIYPGCGYGGSCFPKDVAALSRSALDVGYEANVINAVERANTAQRHLVAEKVRLYFGDDLSGKTFALWGLAFKPNTDDMREAPSGYLIEALWAAGAMIRAYDPIASEAAVQRYGERDDLILCKTAYDALDGADALCVVTEWTEFRSPDFDVMKTKLKTPVIFDGRNIYDPAMMDASGFIYHGIGRGRALFPPADSLAAVTRPSGTLEKS